MRACSTKIAQSLQDVEAERSTLSRDQRTNEDADKFQENIHLIIGLGWGKTFGAGKERDTKGLITAGK